MRLTPEQIQLIRESIALLVSRDVPVRVFGSRLDDAARGGDLDLMLDFAEPITNPALLSAQLAAKISRAMQGRKVDVLISAPNLLRLPIHDVAFQEGCLI